MGANESIAVKRPPESKRLEEPPRNATITATMVTNLLTRFNEIAYYPPSAMDTQLDIHQLPLCYSVENANLFGPN